MPRVKEPPAGPVGAPGQTASAAGGPGVTPSRVAAAITQLETLAQQTLDETGIPGMAIAVVAGDEEPYLKGYGTREVGTDLAVDADTVFQLASMSKPISSTVIAALAGDGLLTWDSRVADLLPQFQMFVPWVTSQVTLRDMFAHRSGLPDHGGDLLEDLGFDREAVLHRMRYIAPASSFRSRYDYTNFGLTAAALAAANAVGASWEDLAARRLFRPLGMAQSSYRFADFMARSNRAVPHMQVDGEWLAKAQRQPDAQAPAGGVSSSARDLARWMRLQLAGGMVDGVEVVAAGALHQTWTPQIVSNPPQNPAVDRISFYGLGWNVGYGETGALRLNHSGAFNLGTGTIVQLFPGLGLGITVLTNAQPIGAADALAFEFCDLAEFGTIRHDYRTIFRDAYAALMAPTYGTQVDYLTPPAAVTPAGAAASYSGAYHSELYGEAIIAAEREETVLRLGPNLTAYPLTHYDRDTYWYQPSGENAFGPSGVTFTIAADGTAASVTIENLNLHGQGSFTRSAAAGA